MKTFAIAAMAAAAQAATLMTEADYAFMKFVSEHGKFYDNTEEFEMRKELFKASDAIINELNSMDSLYEAGHNFMSDYTQEEKDALFGLHYIPDDALPQVPVVEYDFVDNGTKNWCNEGKCTNVRNQGGCGSCWAFSATEVMESTIAIKHGSSPKYLSPQQLVDCSRSYGNNGCDGGWYFWAYDYYKTHAAATDANYPYKGVDGSCKSVSGTYKVSSYSQVAKNTSSIKGALNKAPVNVAINASANPFSYYKGGIITESMGCSANPINHAIAAVGYGTENGQEYYIVRNSWGSRWGESGFVRIGTSSSTAGVCGIHKYVYSVSPS